MERELTSRVDQRVLRRFGHVERMNEYRMARMVLMAEGSEWQVRGRPRLGWMDNMKTPIELQRDNCGFWEIRRETQECLCGDIFV